MGNCCSSRLPNAAMDTPLSPQCQSRLCDIMDKLSRHYNNLEKLNFHLSYFKAKSTAHTSLVGNLLLEVANYKNKRKQEKASLEEMTTLLTAIDFEIQKHTNQAGDEQEKLLKVLQVVETGDRAESLRLCSERLGIYLSSEDREKVAILLIQASKTVKTTSNSLLCYIKFLEDAKIDLKTVNEYFQWNGEITGNEKVDNAKDRISKLRLATSALLSTVETQVKTALKSLQNLERTIEDLRLEMQSCQEVEVRETAEAEKVHKAAQYYLSLRKEETVVVPSRRYAKAAINCFLPASFQPNLSAFGLESRLIKAFSRENSVETSMSDEELYVSLIFLYIAKSQADLSAIRNHIIPQSFESYVYSRTAAANGFLPSLSQLILRLKQLNPAPMAQLACELLRLSNTSESFSLHEEVFLVRAIARLETPIQEENWPMSTAEKWTVGGLVDLETAFELLENWFSEDLETAGSVVAAISTEIPLSALSISYIIHRLNALNLTVEDLFRKLDSRKANILRKEDFVVGIASFLGVFLPCNCLEEVTFLLDKTHSNCIFRTEFAQLFQPNNFSRIRISRISLLTALRKAYKNWQNATRNQLFSEFLALPLRSNCASEADVAIFLRKLDSDLATAQIRLYVQKIVEIGGREIEFEAISGCLQLFPLGKWGKSFFCNDQIAIKGLAWMEEKSQISEKTETSPCASQHTHSFSS